MQVISCPKCNMPIESSNYYLKGVAIRCRNCNYSALPIQSGVDITRRGQIVHNDLFTKELAYESLFKKLSLLFLFLTLSAIWFAQHVAIIFLFASGLFLFGAGYLIMRMHNSKNSSHEKN